MAPHHIDAIADLVYGGYGYEGNLAEEIINRAIQLAATRAYRGVGNLVTTAVREFVDRGIVSGQTSSSLHRKIGITGIESGTDPRPIKRSRAETSGINPTNLFVNNMSYSGYIQRDDQKLYHRVGRPLKRSSRVIRELSTHDVRLVERFQNNQANANSDTANELLGSTVLGYGRTTALTVPGFTGTIDAYQYPFYAFDLTSAYNFNRGSSNTYPAALYRLIYDITNLRWRYIPVYGRDLDDTANTYVWQDEIVERYTGNKDPCGAMAYFRGCSFNFSFVGARNLPCTVYIELWKYNEEAIAPEVVCGSGDSTAAEYRSDLDTDSQERRKAYYFSLMKSQIGLNNQMNGDSNMLKGTFIKRLHTLKFQPTSTTESDPNGHMRNIQLYVEMNRSVSYVWSDNTDGVTVHEIANPDDAFKLTGQENLRPYPEHNKSMYLVVRADINQGHATDGASVTDAVKRNLFPSFDFICRRYRNQLKL